MRSVQAKAQDKKGALMITRLAGLSVLVLAIFGCSTTSSDPYMRPTAAQAGAQAAQGADEPEWMKVQDYRNGGPVPPMERDRLVNEQACTEGIALTAGNLKCK
jgi:hypothetical protein